jgi:hypothetical protein
MKTYNSNQTPVTLDTLIQNLQEEDKRNLALSRTMLGIMVGVAIFYIIILVVKSIVGGPIIETIGGLLVVLAFIIFAWFFKSYTNEYKTIDYGLPTTQMLSKAARRYKLFHGRSFLLFFPLAIEDFGLMLLMHDVFSGPQALTRILIAQAFFVGVLCLAFYIGYLIWRKRQKPLRDNALRMLEELEK